MLNYRTIWVFNEEQNCYLWKTDGTDVKKNNKNEKLKYVNYISVPGNLKYYIENVYWSETVFKYIISKPCHDTVLKITRTSRETELESWAIQAQMNKKMNKVLSKQKKNVSIKEISKKNLIEPMLNIIQEEPLISGLDDVKLK